MKLKTLSIVLGLVLLLIILVRACAVTVKKSVNTAFDEVFTSKDAIFGNTDYTTGEYAIVLDDSDPAIVIDDAAVLEWNKGDISISKSWMTYLPGEGRGPHGIRLYRNNEPLHDILARKFKSFEVGELRQFGKPLELKSVYEPRMAYVRQKDSLSQMQDVYFTTVTEVHPDGLDYRFILFCPSLLVSQQDTVFDEFKYGKAFAQRITESLSHLSGFKTGDNASNGSITPPILSIDVDGSEVYLEQTSGGYATLEGYASYSAKLVFFCTKEFYEQVQSHDFSPSFKREGIAANEIKRLIRERIGQDTEDIRLSEVFKSTFGGFGLGKLRKNKYELRYYQLRNMHSASTSSIQNIEKQN